MASTWGASWDAAWGNSWGAIAAAATVIGRRRRTRRYRTPTPETIRDEYEALKESVPEQVLKPLIGPYLLRGDISALPSTQGVNWSALSQDTEAVIALYDLYLEYIEEEDILALLSGDF